MKYLLLPIHLIKFWYPESLFTFLRTWKNLLFYLEEDLAVFLMWKLLFVPLFHDGSIVGRVLSFTFRLSRILLGLFAILVSSIIIFTIALYWFLLPLIVLLDLKFFSFNLNLINQPIFFSGVGLFVIHVFLNPHKKVWQVKEDKLWSASLLSKKDLELKKVFSHHLVQILLDHLELTEADLSFLELKDKDQLGLEAFNLAKLTESPYINTNHFFVSIVKNTPNIEEKLIKFELSVDDFLHALRFLEKQKRIWRLSFIWDDDFTIHHLKGINRGWLGSPTVELDRVSEDLTRTAIRQGFPDFIGKPIIIRELVHILSQQNNANVILVGPPGSGKSSLIKHLAKQIVKGDAPSALATKRLVILDTTRLLSGMNTQGELAERIRDIFEEIEFAQNVILVVDDIHNLGIGEAGIKMNLYSLILPYIDSSTFQFIATTDPVSYSRIIEKNGSFARLFSKIELAPTSMEESLEILEQKAIEFEKDKKIIITIPSLRLAATLAERYIHDRVLPDSALSILNQAVTDSSGVVNRKLIQSVVSEKVHVPVVETDSAGKKNLLNLEDRIHQKLIDQEEAVKAVSNSLRRSATGIKEEGRPIGSFLFVGPTGVGKTELAKILSETFFDNKGGFIRIDMSEYQNADSVSRLIGVNGEGGILTEGIRENPYSLLLLDEFEKADAKILTLFLQVLEDGRLTDGAGRLIDFRNTVIIATSNVASLTIAQGLEQNLSIDQIDKKVNEEVLQTFKPELVNRFDDIVIFKPLSKEDLQKIVQLKLVSLQNRLQKEGYVIEFERQVFDQLSEKGFDSVLGARPLRRLIQDTLEAKISKLILEEKIQKGNSFKINSLF